MTRLIVRLKEWTPGILPDIFAACGAERIPHKVIPEFQVAVALVPEGADGGAVLAALRAHPAVDPERTGFDSRVTFASVDTTWSLQPAFTDPKLAESAPMWRCGVYHAHKLVAAELAVRLGAKPGGGPWLGDPATKIAVVDTGYLPDAELPTIAEANMWSTVHNTHDATDRVSGAAHGHGNLCLSTIFGRPGNSRAAYGIAPDCTPMIVSIQDGAAVWATDGADGILWAAQNGAHVISCSWGVVDGNWLVYNAVDAAIHVYGASVWAAVGNDGVNVDDWAYLFPMAHPDAMGVSSVNASDSPLYNYGQRIDILAPTGQWAVGANGTVLSFTGTSGSTPVCAAIDGLIRSLNPSLGRAAREAIVRQTATPITGLTADRYPNAAGVINASGACAKTLSEVHPGAIYPTLALKGSGVSTGAAVTLIVNAASLFLDAYCTEPITDLKLYAGATLLRDGRTPAWVQILPGTSPSMRVVAATAGVTLDETYTDLRTVYVSPVSVDGCVLQPDGTIYVYGKDDPTVDVGGETTIEVGGAGYLVTEGGWNDDGGDPPREWLEWWITVDPPLSAPPGDTVVTVRRVTAVREYVDTAGHVTLPMKAQVAGNVVTCSRRALSTVTMEVTAGGGSVGEITYPSATTARATVSGSGPQTLSLSDGTDSLTVTVQGPEVWPLAAATGHASPADLAFLAASGLPLRDSATAKWCPIRYRANGKPVWIRRS